MTTNRENETPAIDTSGADAFPERLASLVGDLSVRAFARKAGVSDTFLRQCLAGRTEPTRTKLVALAHAGGVSVEWLATGTTAATPRTPLPDRELLESIIEVTESVMEERGHYLTPARKAHLVCAVYDTCAAGDRRAISRKAIAELVTCAT